MHYALNLDLSEKMKTVNLSSPFFFPIKEA